MHSRLDLHIGLSKAGVALVQCKGWLGSEVTVLAQCPVAAERSESHQPLLDQLRHLLADAGCSGRSTTMVVADDWARYFIVTPPRNAVCLQDCRAGAELRFQTLFDESAAGWHIEADWDARQPFLACALPHPLLNELQQIATEYRLKLKSLLPHFSAAWNRWRHQLPADAWFGTMHADGLIVGICRQQRLLAVRTSAVPASASQDRQWMVAHLSREALRLNLPTPARIQLAGQVPGTWTAQSSAMPACTLLDSDQTVGHGSPGTEAVMLAKSGVTS